MNKSKIEWTEVTWNPVTGCTKVSEGCRNCYAERMSKRLAGRCGYPKDEPFRVTLHPEKLDEPLKWKKPRRIFVNSMGDLFHEDVPDDFLDRVFAVMAHATCATCATFLILTKRPGRMQQYLSSLDRKDKIGRWLDTVGHYRAVAWPIPNVWLGVSVENQATADERIPLLLQTPAAVRFVSCEPLLGPVDLRPWIKRYYHGGVPGLRVGDTLLPPSVTGKSTLLEYAKEVDPNGPQRTDRVYLTTDLEAARLFALAYPYGHVYRAVPALPLENDPDCNEPGLSYQTPTAIVVPPDTPVIDWVIAGGETGPNARPCNPNWVRSLRDQCQEAGTKFFFKSWGEWAPSMPFVIDHSQRIEKGLPLPKQYVVLDSGLTDEDMKRDRGIRAAITGTAGITMAKVGKRAAGRLLDGRTWDEIPEAGNA